MADVNATQNEAEVDNETVDNTSEADKKLANMVNAAVSSHLKRHLSKFESSIFELKESFASNQSKAQPAADTSKGTKKKESDDESLAMREVEQLKAELKAEKARVKEEQAYASLRNYFSDKVIPERVDIALKLFKADQKVQFRRDGSAFVKHDNAEFDLEEGAAEWLKSKEAMMFLPAPGGVKKGGAVQSKNLPFKTPAKVSPSGSQDQPTNPAMKTLLQLQKLGINI